MKKIVLLGNPNVGKTTVFNKLTQENEETGNYAGTTLESKQKEIIYKNETISIIDIPGMYGYISPQQEEKVAWEKIEKLMEEDNIFYVQIINADHFLQSKELTTLLQKKGIPLSIVINLKGKHYSDEQKQSIQGIFGEDIIFISAENIIPEKFLERVFFATKQRKIEPKQTETINSIKKSKRNEERKKFPFDGIVLHPIFGSLCFAAIMWIIFQLVFTIGAIPMGYIDAGVLWTIEQGKSIFGESLISLLFFDGIIGGIGATIMFLPNILLLFFGLSFLKESGYLSRSSYLFNNIFKKIGLSGRVSVPLLMGFGCNVPAIMAVTTLENKKEKISVAMMSLFMSCSARLPVYTLLIGAFIPSKWQGITLFSIYIFGICIALFTGSLINRLYPQKSRALVLQMPNYALPSIKNAIRYAHTQAKDFLERVWKFIIPASIILWGLFTFPLQEVESNGIESSYGASIAKTIQPVFAPLGFDWTITAGVIAGIAAKEVMVANFAQIYGQEANEESLGEYLKTLPQFSLASVLALMVFTLLYMPCIAVIATIKAQLGTKWAIIGAVYPTIVAWIFGFLVYQGVNLISIMVL